MRLTLAALAIGLSLSTTAAFATTFTVAGGYTVSEQYTTGGPTISYGLSHTAFSQSGTEGTKTGQTAFFTANPAATCANNAQNVGGCIGGSSGTETDPLTIMFTGLTVNVGGSKGTNYTVPTFTETATYTAKYSGNALGCTTGDGVSPNSGKTDCLLWTGWTSANNLAYDGSIMYSQYLGGGNTLEVFLYNATDWSITPTIAFEVVDSPAPEPASLALIASGLVGLGLIRRRRT